MNKEVIILELASLERTLDFIQEGQAFIKTKLTDKLEDNQDNNLLIWAEDIHQQIINRELAIQLLKKDVKQIDRSLKLLNGNKIIGVEKLALIKKFTSQVSYLEQEFLLWKNNVNNYIELSGSSTS
ncbi:MAG: hypothetical protein RL387_547 [Bacteroidota bacterium]|jgi:hypothetical protein